MKSRLKYLILIFLLLGTKDIESKVAKSGYNIEITCSENSGKKLYLINKSALSVETVIDSTTFNSKGKAKFKSSKTDLTGEYVIALENDIPLVSLLFSYRNKIKEVISFKDNRIVHKGSKENNIFIEYQNLIRTERSEISSPEELLNQMVQIIREAEGYDLQSLVYYYFSIRFPQFIDDPDVAVDNILNDPKILNTSFLTPLTDDFIREQKIGDIKGTIENIDSFLLLCGNKKIELHIAKTLFDHYHESKLMGSENICVHIAENYLLTEDNQLIDNTSLALLRIYVEYNKHSLIGMQAPEIILYDTLLNPISFIDSASAYKIIYFYDDQCSVCRQESPKLLNLMALHQNSDIMLYMVFTGEDIERMKSYIKFIERDFPDIPGNKIHHLWDPFSGSDYGELYSVLIKPQMFLLDRTNTILGRNLSTSSLTTLLQQYSQRSSGLHALFDDYFKEYISDPQNIEIQDLYNSIDILFRETSVEPSVFKEIFKELYYYLKAKEIYELQLGAVYLAERYILAESDIWGSESDLYEEIEYAVELFYRNPIGSKAIDLQLNDLKGNRVNLLDNKSNFTVLYFYDMDCPICELLFTNMKRIAEEFKESLNVNFISIYVGNDHINWYDFAEKIDAAWTNLSDPYYESGMHSKYDLTTVPSIYLLNSEKIVIAKDITPSTLEAIFSYLYNQ